MKKLILFFLIPSFSCNNANSAAERATETLDKVGVDLKNQVACEAFQTTDLAEILNWELAAIKSESMGHSEGKRSICRFSKGADILWVRFGWKSEKAMENKVLETQFKGYLSSGENGVVYESIEGNFELFGQKPADATYPQLYIFRKRFDNKAEVTFELYSNKMSKEEALKSFMLLLKKV